MFRRRPDEDFSDEIRAHLEIEADRLEAEGLSAERARQGARRSFGNVTRARERFYEAGRWMWLEHFGRDLRYASRGLMASPAFLATAVLTLAVGIGLVTAAFSVFNAYVLRPYAVRDPFGLHRIAWRSPDGGGQRFRWRDYEVIRARGDLFTGVVAESTRFVSSNGRPLAVALVSGNYFEDLAPAILLGRGLAGFDEGAAAGEPAVLSHQAWRRLFDGDPGAVGRPIDLNGRPFVIVGVAAPAFVGLGDLPRDVWVPLTAYAAVAMPELIGPDQPHEIEMTARLRPGVTREQAESALRPAIAAAIEGEADVRAHVAPQPSPNPISLEMMAVLSPVFAAFVLVLVTACANASNVMLARALGRQREIAMRLSLGAGRGRVVRQLLTEGLLVSALAGIAGLVLAVWTLRGATLAILGTIPPSVGAILRFAPIDFDGRVFGFALVAVAAATLAFALLPALHASRFALTDVLRGETTAGRRGARLRSLLVVAQVGVSLVLVITAITLARSGATLGSIDLGYDARGVISVNVRDDQDGLVRRVAEALEADPRVAEVAVTGGNPLFIRTRAVAAAPGHAVATTGTRYTFVSPEYFSILGIPISQGRGFRPEEGQSAARVAVVSAATAKAFWPGGDPLGKTIRIEPPDGRPTDDLPGYSTVTVVGTVRDVVSGLLMDGRDAGHIYLPTGAAGTRAAAVLVRGRSDRDLGPGALQEVFRRAAPDPEVFEAIPLEEMRALQVYPLQAASWVGLVLGIVALALSVSGLYGVLTFTLNQRTREIGIRMALGATAGAVVRLVMAQSARLAGVGALAGLVVAFVVLRMLNAAIQLRHISLVDLAAFAIGVVLVLAAAVLAAFQPARRATRVSPAVTLRSD